MQREIDRSEWRKFFDEFSRRHDGWLVTLDSSRAGCGFHDFPLRGIAVDDTVIEVFAHGPEGAHLAHIIRRPVKVISDETDDGADVAVTIVDATGERTGVRFRSAVPAETVNGMAGFAAW